MPNLVEKDESRSRGTWRAACAHVPLRGGEELSEPGEEEEEGRGSRVAGRERHQPAQRICLVPAIH